MLDVLEENKPYNLFKKDLNRFPFLMIIGKYDQILGPRALVSSIELKDEEFIRNLLRDALNTKNKFVILDFNRFYSQVCKVSVEDKTARGGKQLYAIILLRHVEYPLIPILHFKRIEMLFHKIDIQKILADDELEFESFFKRIQEIYMNKDELLPMESINLQIRSGINTVQGFCELALEVITSNGEISKETVKSFLEMMLDACNDVTKALNEPLSNTTK